MKRILLTSTALTMVAGIAAADGHAPTLAGTFKLGFNDTQSNRDVTGTIQTAGAESDDYRAADTSDNNYGVYNDAGITIAMASTMDSGMTAGITVDLNGSDFDNNAAGAYTVALASDAFNLTFGTTEYSAITNWKSAGDMGTDTWANQNDSGGNVLRADVTLGGLAVSASALVTVGEQASPEPMSITVGGSLGGASFVIANEGSKMGVSVSAAVGGATLTGAYSTAPTLVASKTVGAATAKSTGGFNSVTTEVADAMSTSTGIKVAYPMGAITTTASYVMESGGTGGDDIADSWNVSAAYSAGTTKLTVKTDENTQNSVEGSTAMGSATVSAGLADNLEDMYLAVSNPLGGGATIMASYAVDGDDSGHADDEVGAGNYQEGLTVELSFKF